MADDEEELALASKKRRKAPKNEFIDDEAELSGDDAVSEDELEESDEDALDDLNLVDKEAKDLDSEEEEEVRGLYFKQLETEDKRAVLVLKEQLEDKVVPIGQLRRKKYKWQIREMAENSLRRHYDPDDDDSEEGDDDDIDYGEFQTRIRRPTAEALLMASTRVTPKKLQPAIDIDEDSVMPQSGPSKDPPPVATSAFSDDSSSNTLSRVANATRTTNATSDLSRFVLRDKELVEALSTRELVVASREDKEKVIQRELRRVLQSKSIFDQLYS